LVFHSNFYNKLISNYAVFQVVTSCSLIAHYQLSKEFDASILIIFRSLMSHSALWSMSIPWVGLLSGFHTCYSGGEQGNFCSCQLQNRGRSDP